MLSFWIFLFLCGSTFQVILPHYDSDILNNVSPYDHITSIITNSSRSMDIFIVSLTAIHFEHINFVLVYFFIVQRIIPYLGKPKRLKCFTIRDVRKGLFPKYKVWCLEDYVSGSYTRYAMIPLLCQFSQVFLQLYVYLK